MIISLFTEFCMYANLPKRFIDVTRAISCWLPLLDEFRTLNWKKIKRELEESGFLELFPVFSFQN